MTYKILTSAYTAMLERELNHFIKEGWEVVSQIVEFDGELTIMICKED